MAFTSDTKAEDGFSAQSLIADWEAAEQADYDQRNPEPSPATKPDTKPAKKEKRSAKQQKKRASTHREPSEAFQRPDSAEGTPEYVRYLEQYFTDRSNWKFNKNKQQNVLKHIFNLYRIPEEHNEALLAYISGLQGAAARQRLLGDAEGVLQGLLQQQNKASEIEGMETPAARKAAYDRALQREIDTIERSGGGRSEYDDQQLQEIRSEVERAKRADAVLVELLRNAIATSEKPAPSAAEPPPTSSPNPSSSTPNSSKTKPNRRKRKARTEISSSDESSSDSDSSASEGE